MNTNVLIAAANAHMNDHGGPRLETCQTCRRYAGAIRRP